MKKVLVSLLLSLLCVQLLSCLSVDKRREMVYTKERRLKMKKEGELKGVRAQVIPMVALTAEEVGVDASAASTGAKVSTGKVRFFSMMPVRLVRRPQARYLVILNIKLEIVDCETNFDYRLCYMNCAKYDSTIDKRCVDCTKAENKADHECVKQQKRETCDKAAANEKYVFNKADDCCDYIFKDCYKVKNDKLLTGCCSEEKYKLFPQCGCQYVLDNQKIFPESKIRSCCEQIEKETGVPDKRCNSICTAEDDKCCAKAYLQPLKFPNLYSECCTKNTAAKECACDYKINNPTLFPKQAHETCCAQDKYQKLPECIDCEKNFEANDKCCSPFIANPMKSQEKTKACCALPIFKDHDNCKKCEGVSCCEQDKYKKSDLCVCAEMVKKVIDFNNKEEKKCFCTLNPSDERCVDCSKTPGNKYCCENYLNNPTQDSQKYDFCCDKFPTDKQCICETIVKTPSNFLDSSVLKCCQLNSKLNPDVCCERARLNLNVFSNQDQESCCSVETIKKLSATDDGRAKCCEKFPKTIGCTPPMDCNLGVSISQECCAVYEKTPSKYPTQTVQCCTQSFLEQKFCSCESVMSKPSFYGGLNNKLVEECCKDKQYLNNEVCNICLNAIVVPDSAQCCEQIISKKFINYKTFPICCQKEAYKTDPLCKPDCTKTPTDPSCCAEYFVKPIDHETNYVKCCDNQNLKKTQAECQCTNILATPANYPPSTVAACCQDLPPKHSAELEAFCNKCDCVATPKAACCQKKCMEVFKNPYSDLALFDQCCQDNLGAAECQCSAIVNILKTTKADDKVISKKMIECCMEKPNFLNKKWAQLGCQNCHYNTDCCDNYFKDKDAFKTAYEKTNPVEFENYVNYCCSNSKTPYENGCPTPTPEECVDSNDLRCCLDLDSKSPMNKQFESCCANSEFKDTKKICSCASRPAGLKDYPSCCDSHFDASHCCKTEVEYTSSYKAKCCENRFDVKSCCDNGNFVSLLLEKQKACCNENYNPQQCCQVKENFDKTKCCNVADQFRDECCAEGSDISIDNFKAKCCSDKTRVFNSVKSDKECKKPPKPCAQNPKLYPPCPYHCKPDDEECKCKQLYPNNPSEYFKCTCLNNKLNWNKKDCFCSLNPAHISCQCEFENILVKPSLRKECCKDKEKKKCDCNDLYIKYGGPSKLEDVEEADKTAYKTCCDKYFCCGFCYNDKPTKQCTTCTDVLTKADKTNNEYKKCCSSVLVEMDASKKPNMKEDAQVIKCCLDFSEFFSTNKLCQHKKDPCLDSDITDLTSAKHTECCLKPEYKDKEGCQKCTSAVFSDTSSADYNECCTQNKDKCCTPEVFKDVSSPAYNICCDAQPDKCCLGNYKEISDVSHKVCCESKRDCCTQDIYLDPNHADHAFCCSLNKDKCKNPPKCTLAVYKDKKNTQYLKCCKEYPIPEFCAPPADCLTTVLNDPKQKDSVQWVQCCTEFKTEEVCQPSKDCHAIFEQGNFESQEYKDCCKKYRSKCPDNPTCYPETVYTDPTDKKHKTCCEKNPKKDGCSQKTECTVEIYTNVNNPLHEWCCNKNPDAYPKLCSQDIPCITECNEDNEVFEEFYNKEGYVTMNGRMKKKKKTYQQMLKHINNAKANASRHQ